jgi:peptide/nickel transport system substrate-binding protein
MEALRGDSFAEAAQRKAAADMERETFAMVPYVPLGQMQQPTAFRNAVTGIVPASAPLFWNLRKA